MSRPNIEQLLRRKFKNKVRKSRGRNGVEFKVNCPFCGNKKYKLYINPVKNGGVYNCYRCGKAGSLRTLFGDMWAASTTSGPDFTPRPKPLVESQTANAGNLVPVGGLEEDNPAVSYLKYQRIRPFDPEDISTRFGARFCISGGYVQETEDFKYDCTGTLIFPVWMFGSLVGWQSRLLYTPEELDDDQCRSLKYKKDEDDEWLRPPKYLTSPGFEKGRVLFNFDVARKYNFVVVTEGVFDAMAVGEPAVATFGTGISPQQCNLLKTYWDTVIVLLDPEGTDKQTEELITELKRSVDVIRIDLQNHKDPGDAPTDELWVQISDQINIHRARRNL